MRKMFNHKLILIMILLIGFIVIRHIYNTGKGFYLPSYEKKNIANALTSINRTDADDRLLFLQTGLSPAAIRDFQQDENTESINTIHQFLFQKPIFKINYIFYPLTAEERNEDQLTPLAPLKSGDVLITFNTHTCDWRHGHCAIITNGVSGQMIEHKSVGQTSCFSNACFWGTYPSFLVLRYKDEKTAAKAANYAKEHLTGVKYSILAGILKKDKSDEPKPESSQCSHIVWQAYKAAGTDIDSDKGILITPSDIAECTDFQVVQVYGLDAEKYINRMCK